MARKRASSATELVGLPGSFTQSRSARPASCLADGVEIEVPAGVDRDRYRSTSRQRGAHLVRRVRDGRVQDGVPGRRAQPQQVRQRRDELLGPHARADLLAGDLDAEASRQPTAGRVAQFGAARRGRIAHRRFEHARSRTRRDLGNGIARGSDRAVDDAAGHPLGDNLERIESFVRVRRRHEARVGHRDASLVLPTSATRVSRSR